MVEFICNNWVTLLGYLAAILAGLWAYRKEIIVERYKNKLEYQKLQRTLNDEKFRDGYQKFISLMFSVVMESKTKKEIHLDKIQTGILNFMEMSLLFAGPDVVKAFGKYRKESNNEDKSKILIYVGDLIMKMRDDLGVSNDGMKEYDILQTFLIGDVEEEIKKLKNKS